MLLLLLCLFLLGGGDGAAATASVTSKWAPLRHLKNGAKVPLLGVGGARVLSWRVPVPAPVWATATGA